MSDEGKKSPPQDDGSIFFFVVATFCVAFHVLAALLPHFAVFMLPLLLLATLGAVIFIIVAFVQAVRRERMLLQVLLLFYGVTIFICWATVISSGRW